MRTNNKIFAMFLLAALLASGIVITADSDDADAATEVGNFEELKNHVQITSGYFDVKLSSDIVVESTLMTTVDGKIDLNGHNLTASDKRILQVKSGEVEITGEGNITANKSTTWDSGSSVIRVGDSVANAPSAKLTIGSGVTVSTNNCYGVSVFNGLDKDHPATNTVSLILNGTVTVTGESAAISGVGNGHNGPTEIVINSTAKVSATQNNAIYFPCSGSLSVNGMVIGGIEIKAGNGYLQIGENASITASGAKNHTTCNNGTSTRGFAIAVCENSNYKGNATFNITGGTVTGDVALLRDTETCEKNAKLTISGGYIDGKIYKGYDGDGYSPTGTISVTGGIFTYDPAAFVATGYGSYEQDGKFIVGKECTVTFDTDGGSPVASQTVVKGNTVTQPADPTKEGSFFDGWLTATGDEYDFSTPVAQDMTLYADWSDVTVEEDVEPYVDEEGNVGEKITAKATYIDGSTEETELIAVEVGDEARLSEETVFTDPKGNTITISSTGSVTRSGASIQITSGSIEGTSVSIAMAEIISSAAEESDAFELDLTVSTPAVTIPSSLLDDKNISSVTIAVNSESENSARITVPAGALSLDSDHGAVVLSVSSSNVSAPSNSRAVFELNIAGASTTFSEPVTISYDVDIPSGASNIRAYCIDNGDSVEAVYSNGIATFDLEHFSSWAIICDVYIDSEDEWEIQYILEQQKRAQEAAASQTTTEDNSGEEAAVIIAAAAVAGAMLACAFFAFRRP